MESFDPSDKKKAIIAATWKYLLRTGLTNASVGELCRAEKLAQSSLYYWFKNKDDIWISAGKYGLSNVINAVLLFTLNHVHDVKGYFDTLLDEIEKYKAELRCIVQITVSYEFGKRMREAMMEFNNSYADFAKQLVDIFDCTYEQAEIFIYTVLASIIDYVVWEDREKTQIILDNLYEKITKVIRID